MKRYTITEKAGRIVAGHSNTGVGTEVELTEEQAASALAAGELLDRSLDTAEQFARGEREAEAEVQKNGGITDDPR